MTNRTAMTALSFAASSLLLLLFVLTWSASANAQAAGDRCVVTDPTGTPLNVRARPQGQIQTSLQNGTSVVVRGVSRDSRGRIWAQLERPAGWVFGPYLSCGNNAVRSAHNADRHGRGSGGNGILTSRHPFDFVNSREFSRFCSSAGDGIRFTCEHSQQGPALLPLALPSRIQQVARHFELCIRDPAYIDCRGMSDISTGGSRFEDYSVYFSGGSWTYEARFRLDGQNRHCVMRLDNHDRSAFNFIACGG